MEIPEKIRDRLCTYDPRNPCYIEPEPGEEVRPPRRPGCACDNCFYASDRLAVVIIAQREALSDALGFVVASKIAGQKQAAPHFPAPYSVETKIRDALNL
jgi:hypothetical protein